MKFIFRFFDKLEDRVRGWFSHYPILYALIGGIGVVIFWRGVWHTYDYLMERFFAVSVDGSTVNIGGLPWWDGPVSLVLGSAILLMTGVFVSSFIGNEVIISGLKGEKKMAEKTEEEIKTESTAIGDIRKEIRVLARELKNANSLPEARTDSVKKKNVKKTLN